MVILGLGSNLGDRTVHLKRAIARLSRGSDAALTGVRLSRVYESAALLPAGAPDAWDLPYLNCALAGETTLEPAALLRRILEIEKSLGREDHAPWAPRIIDIDILWWPGREVRSESLTIPHPEILERPFVLEPMKDLVPEAMLDGETVEARARRAGRVAPGRAGQDERPRAALHSPEADFQVGSPTLMGVLNLTPNSFSDGGHFMEPEIALEHARRLVEAGAGIVDVGAESTRPDGVAVDPRTEWARLEPVLHGLRELQREALSPGPLAGFKISLDSRNPATVRSALEVGVDVLNDVTGFRQPGMLEIAQETDVPVIFMHSLSIPVVRGESIPRDRDPVEFLIGWARDRLEVFEAAGIDRHRLVYDPGLGFGKSVDQNWWILEQVERFHDLEIPLLVGHSRKSFLEAVTDKPSAERDPETLLLSRALAAKGVEILRVHDVKGHAALFGRDHSIPPDSPLAHAVGRS